MQPVSFDELLEQGRKSASVGESWHFHVVKDSCQLLERDAEVLFVLEHGSQTHAISASGTKTDVADVAELAELLHRVSTTSADRAYDNPISSLTPDLQSILQQAQQFTEQRVPWHHHVLFPDCILNDTPGAWKVLIEGNGAILSATAADEPTQLLSELEPLFYSQSAK